MQYIIFYIILIVCINFGFAHSPLVTLPNGELWPPISLAVGFTFVVRDYAQRKVGHNILWAMFFGCIISWFMVSPELALASAAAFAIGELSDWGIYSLTKKPFAQRIILSSLLSTPLDSIVFLTLIDLLSPTTFIAMTLSKMFGAIIVYTFIKHREKQIN